MYYKYKAKKKKNRFKYVFILLFIVAVVFAIVRYREQLFFWEYSTSGLNKQFKKISLIQDFSLKKKLLLELVEKFKKFKSDDLLSEEIYLMSAKANFRLGELLLVKDFFTVVKDSDYLFYKSIEKKYFLDVIRDIKKAIAIQGDSYIDLEYRIMLSKAYYYSRYKEIDAAYILLYELFENPSKLSVADVRFCSIVSILAGESKKGLDLLNEYGNSKKNTGGKLFKASAEKLAGNNTNAIIIYKEILLSDKNEKIQKMVNLNLAKLYFDQRLYNQSVKIYRSYEDDDFSSLMIAKNYFALGYKKQARKIWVELLKKDEDNADLKKLLRKR